MLQFLTHLAVAGNVAASTQNQALNALVFLYEQVLQRPLGDLGEFARVNRPARLPEVLTPEQTQRVLAALKPGTTALIVRLLYGTGLRLIEVLRLPGGFYTLNPQLSTLNTRPTRTVTRSCHLSLVTCHTSPLCCRRFPRRYGQRSD